MGTMDHFVTLNCPACGGELDVYDDINRFACVSCGTKMIVQRRGGTVSLAAAKEVLRLEIAATNGTAGKLAGVRRMDEKNKLAKLRSRLSEGRISRTKWGFGIGGALLLAGIVASKTVKNLKARPVRRAELPPGLPQRVETLRSVLAEVCPMTRAQWLDRLKRDFNPEKEVLWWERVAACFSAFTTDRRFSSGQRQAVFKIICGLCSGLREQDLATDLAKLPASDCSQLAMAVRSLQL